MKLNLWTSIVIYLAIGTMACASIPTPLSLVYSDEKVEIAEIYPVQAVQETTKWCWAACAEMILTFNGYPASQEEIVARIHGYDEEGELKVEFATRYEAYRALSPQTEVPPFEIVWDKIRDEVSEEVDKSIEAWGDRDDVQSPASVEVGLDRSVVIQDVLDRMAPTKSPPIVQLEEGQPAIAGIFESETSPVGHVVVLVGAEFRKPRGLLTSVSSVSPRLESKLLAAVLRRFGGSIPSEQSLARTKNLASRLGHSEYDIQSVTYVDPKAPDDTGTPENEMRVVLSFDEFIHRVNFIVTQQDAHDILMRWSEAIDIEAGDKSE